VPMWYKGAPVLHGLPQDLLLCIVVAECQGVGAVWPLIPAVQGAPVPNVKLGLQLQVVHLACSNKLVHWGLSDIELDVPAEQPSESPVLGL